MFEEEHKSCQPAPDEGADLLTCHDRLKSDHAMHTKLLEQLLHAPWHPKEPQPPQEFQDPILSESFLPKFTSESCGVSNFLVYPDKYFRIDIKEFFFYICECSCTFYLNGQY